MSEKLYKVEVTITNYMIDMVSNKGAVKSESETLTRFFAKFDDAVLFAGNGGIAHDDFDRRVESSRMWECEITHVREMEYKKKEVIRQVVECTWEWE